MEEHRLRVSESKVLGGGQLNIRERESKRRGRKLYNEELCNCYSCDYGKKAVGMGRTCSKYGREIHDR